MTPEHATLTIETLGRWAERTPRQGQPLSIRFHLSDTLAIGERLAELARTDKHRALRLASALVEIVRVDGTQADLAVAERCRAHAQLVLRRIAGALRDYRSARRRFLACGLPVEAARTTIGLLGALIFLGRTREAIRLGRGARAELLRAGETRRAARLDVNLANAYERLGRYRPALERYEAAESTFQHLGDDTDLAVTRYNRARVLVSMDRLHEALPVYQASAAAWEKHSMTAAFCQCRLELGNLLFRLGRLTEAMSILERAEAGAVALEDQALEAIASLELARVEVLVNRQRPAAVRLDRAIQRFETLKMLPDQAEALTLRALIDFGERRASDGLARLERAARLFRRIGNRSRLWWVELQRALALDRATERAESVRALRGCVRAFARVHRRGLEVEARIALADRLLDAGSSRVAPLLDRSEALASTLSDPWIEYRVALTRARFEAAGPDPQRALRPLETAFRSMERLRQALPLEIHRAFFLADKDDLFERALEVGRMQADLSAATRRARTRGAHGARSAARWALVWSDRAHAPRLRDAWRHGLARSEAGSDAEAATGREIARLRERLYGLDALERVGRDGTQDERSAAARTRALERWRARRAAATSRLERLFHRFEMQSASRFGVDASTEPDPARIQAVLGPDERLIEYFAGSRTLHAITVSRSTIEHTRLSTPSIDVELLVHRLRRLWARYAIAGPLGASVQPALDRTAEVLLRELRAALLDPLFEGRTPPRDLVVVPHRWLHGVPFHAFPTSSGVVADHHRVRYALSARSLVEAPPPGRATGSALVVGVDSTEAPTAALEAIEVGRVHPGCHLLTGTAATPDAVRSGWSNARVVHIAAHADTREDEPRLSGLRLAGGTWSVHDLYALQTRADLVALSGCGTGETVLWGGDDSVGLLPALFQTGARAAVVSLWPVDDHASRQTMVHFHEQLTRSKSPMEALRSAWNTLKASRSSPYLWAPFVLYGTDHLGTGDSP